MLTYLVFEASWLNTDDTGRGYSWSVYPFFSSTEWKVPVNYSTTPGVGVGIGISVSFRKIKGFDCDLGFKVMHFRISMLKFCKGSLLIFSELILSIYGRI